MVAFICVATLVAGVATTAGAQRTRYWVAAGGGLGIGGDSGYQQADRYFGSASAAVLLSARLGVELEALRTFSAGLKYTDTCSGTPVGSSCPNEAFFAVQGVALSAIWLPPQSTAGDADLATGVGLYSLPATGPHPRTQVAGVHVGVDVPLFALGHIGLIGYARGIYFPNVHATTAWYIPVGVSIRLAE